MKEIYKDIVGYEGIYKVSNLGAELIAENQLISMTYKATL